MKMTELGKTGLKISRIGFGGIPIQRITAEETVELFKLLKDLGINFIDTARGYTVSEEYIGKALEVVGRKNFIIATKSMARTGDKLREEFNISKKNLNIDCVDLYQFHNVKTLEEYETITSEGGAYEEALKLKEEGLISHIGITSHNKDLLDRIIESKLFETIQFPYNPMERQGEESLKKAHANGMGVITMKPLAGGAIKNKNYSLRFIFEQDFVSAIIPGMASKEEAIENAQVGNNFTPLSDEERKVLMDEAKELGDHFCRRCGYCAPCTVGIDIPTNFLMEGYYKRYNLQEWATSRYNQMNPNAKDCIECGVCEERCPYDLKIRDMLKEVAKTFE